MTYLQYYLNYFGDRCHQSVDLTPNYEGGITHRSIDEKLIFDKQQAMEDMDKYTHPCWCNPELIYTDDTRGNEVWLHKPIQ